MANKAFEIQERSNKEWFGTVDAAESTIIKVSKFLYPFLVTG